MLGTMVVNGKTETVTKSTKNKSNTEEEIKEKSKTSS